MLTIYSGLAQEETRSLSEGVSWKVAQMQKDLKWLLKELEGIREFNPEKERIEFRADIFSRIVEKGTIFPDGRIIYDLRLGIQWAATGNDRKAWQLKMKKSKKN